MHMCFVPFIILCSILILIVDYITQSFWFKFLLELMHISLLHIFIPVISLEFIVY